MTGVFFSMSEPPLKTPRTLLNNYLDVSKTQTVKVTRNNLKHVSLVRTPDMQSEQNKQKPGSLQSPFFLPRALSPEQYIGTKIVTSRTPEMYMSSKSKPKHDRVSTLQSKRRSTNVNDVKETPRQWVSKGCGCLLCVQLLN